jgi:hypothetical protein
MISRPQLLDLQIPAFHLVLHVSLACKVFWIIHKTIRFVGELAVHLLLGLAINKIYTKRKIKTNLRKLGLDKLD